MVLRGERESRWLMLFALIWLAAGCGESPRDPRSPETLLLERAIGAAWGDRDPDDVRSMRRVSTVAAFEAEDAPLSRLETLVAGADRYRERRDSAWGFTEVWAMAGERSWATVDGTLVPLEEAETRRRRLQPWLFEISKLGPLRDAERFQLEHLGRRELPGGLEVEELRVQGREHPEVAIVLAFRTSDHLVHRVTLTGPRGEEELSLVLDDYRAIGGVRVPHRVLAFRGEQLVARQDVESVELGVEVSAELFAAPEAPAKEPVKRKETSIAGLFACALHAGPADDPFETVEPLLEWMERKGLAVAGPLVLAREGALESDGLRVCVAAARQGEPEDVSAEKVEDERFSLRTIEAGPVLYLTHVGLEPAEELVDRVNATVAERGLAAEDRSYEVWFSKDGKVRQIQVPLH